MHRNNIAFCIVNGMYGLIWNYDFGCCQLSQFILILLSACSCCCCLVRWDFFCTFYLLCDFVVSASNNIILLGEFITNCIDARIRNKLALQAATSSVDRQAKLTAQRYIVRATIRRGPKKVEFMINSTKLIHLIIHFVHNFHFSLACLQMHCWRTRSQIEHLISWAQRMLFHSFCPCFASSWNLLRSAWVHTILFYSVE